MSIILIIDHTQLTDFKKFWLKHNFTILYKKNCLIK